MFFLQKYKKKQKEALFIKKNYIFAKKKNMRFSVITINYNNKEGLEHTIESVLSQTNKDYEYIIIDGGSTDGSMDVIKTYQDHITYWLSEKDQGVYHAMNKGVAHAHGDYLIFMNSGDRFYSPDVLSSLYEYQEDIICGKVLKGDSSRPSGHHKQIISLVDLMRASLPHQAMFIKRELLLKHPYDEKYKILSDWKFSIETIIFDNCSFRNIDIIVANYDTTGISTNSNGLLPKERELILKELFPPRITIDYERLTPVDDELLDQSLLLTQTVGARKLVKSFSNFVLKFINKKN
jgi:glycosyltransferase involved in cell wall biosynthesis